MFDKMSKRANNNTTPTLPEEQYDLITNWISDLPPLTKKPRLIHPRQRGHNNNQRQQHQQHNHLVHRSNHQLLHQKQPLDQQREHRHQQSKIKFRSPLKNNFSMMDYQKAEISPSNPYGLRCNSKERCSPKRESEFITSLDYSVKPEYNEWRFDDTTIIKNVVTKETILVPTDVLLVRTKVSFVQTLNEWRLRSRNVNERIYAVVKKILQVRSTFSFESLTAFPNLYNYHSEETPSDED